MPLEAKIGRDRLAVPWKCLDVSEQDLRAGSSQSSTTDERYGRR